MEIRKFEYPFEQRHVPFSSLLTGGCEIVQCQKIPAFFARNLHFPQAIHDAMTVTFLHRTFGV